MTYVRISCCKNMQCNKESVTISLDFVLISCLLINPQVLLLNVLNLQCNTNVAMIRCDLIFYILLIHDSHVLIIEPVRMDYAFIVFFQDSSFTLFYFWNYNYETELLMQYILIKRVECMVMQEIISQQSFSYYLYLICVRWEGANVIDFQLLLSYIQPNFRLSLIYGLCERVLRHAIVIGCVLVHYVIGHIPP